jgi:hypothetical protein
MDMPVLQEGKTQKRVDLHSIQTVFGLYAVHAVTIEKAQSMPRQGVVSVANYMQGYGEIYGLCFAMGIVMREVRPVTWKKAMLKDMPKGGKDVSIVRVRQLMPTYKLPGRKKDHGIADAILIALYGQNVSETL